MIGIWTKQLFSQTGCPLLFIIPRSQKKQDGVDGHLDMEKAITHGHCVSDKKKTAGPKVTAVRSVLSCRNKLLKPSSGSSLAAFGQTVTDAMFLHNCCFCVHTKTNVSVHPFVDERVRNTPSTMGNFQTSLMSILPGVIPERPISTGHCHE